MNIRRTRQFGWIVATLLGIAGWLPIPAGAAPAAVADDNTGAATRAQATDKGFRANLPRFAPDRVLVRFRPGTAAADIAKAHRRAGGTKLREIPHIGVHLVRVPAGRVEQKVTAYLANPNVEFAEPDYYRVLIVPDEGNDPGPDNGGVVAGREFFDEQWGLHNTGQDHTTTDELGFPSQVAGTPDADIDAPEAWDISTGDASVKIGILDTGVQCESVDLAGKCVEQISFVGDFSDYGTDPADYIGHGTHVAGIAGTLTNNGIGIAGAGWQSSLGNLKACFSYTYYPDPENPYYYTYVGVCPVSASAAAITYAADHDYHVINMSYASDDMDGNGDPTFVPPPQPNTETAALAYAWGQGVVIVAAAGNNGNFTEIYPAANPEVIAVGATNHFDNLASFSSFSQPGNPWVSLLAPGEDILSTWPSADCVFLADLFGYTFDPATEACLTWNSGTSMASPHVAGAAALVWAYRFPGQSPSSCTTPTGVACNEVVRAHLQYGADATGAGAQNMQAWSEFGRLNMRGALDIVDTDLDGLPDSIDDDDDGDGLSDTDESGLGTDPLDADSDDDGLLDGEEVNYATPPPDTYTPGQDTDPLNPDTDADGFLDGMEVAAGHDPLNGGDAPLWGDADDNGVVNAADLLLITGHVVGANALADDAQARVDIAPVIAGVPTPDGVVNAADLAIAQQIVFGTVVYP